MDAPEVEEHEVQRHSVGQVMAYGRINGQLVATIPAVGSWLIKVIVGLRNALGLRG